MGTHICDGSREMKLILGHYERWMISGQEIVFLFGSSSIANHGGQLSCFLFFYLPINNPQAGCHIK
jgi:hypothetical protein